MRLLESADRQTSQSGYIESTLGHLECVVIILTVNVLFAVVIPIDGDGENLEANAEMALQPINGKVTNYNKMEFPRHDLEALRTLGNGSYGRAFLARASGIKDGERETMVVVKSLMSKDDIQKEDFLRELNSLINMDNPHVVALLGVCRDMDPLYMIFESVEKVRHWIP